MAKEYDIDIEKAELPEDPLQSATELLDSRYETAGVAQEDIELFRPLVHQLAKERPDLLASLIAELHNATDDEDDE
jgi:ATP-dependent RNA helicase DeaD